MASWRVRARDALALRYISYATVARRYTLEFQGPTSDTIVSIKNIFLERIRVLRGNTNVASMTMTYEGKFKKPEGMVGPSIITPVAQVYQALYKGYTSPPSGDAFPYIMRR